MKKKNVRAVAEKIASAAAMMIRIASAAVAQIANATKNKRASAL
jgi:hypothetical protein